MVARKHCINWHFVSTGTAGPLIVYTGPQSWFGVVGDRLVCDYHPRCRMLENYASYKPRVVEDVALTERTLLIFPEVMLEASVLHHVAARAIWWLSVDNAFKYSERLRDRNWRFRFFADPTIVHFHQSEYAADFLRANGVQRSIGLSDFVDREFFCLDTATDVGRPRREAALICFFPRKGGSLAEVFSSTLQGNAGEIEMLPLENMTRASVRDALSRATVYIDFGHHPGKDRIPREASAAGAIVILHRRGAGRFFGDHPLEDEYLFDTDDVASGNLASRLRRILQNPPQHVARQQLYRQKVLLEPEAFDLEVRSFFFAGRAR